MGRENGPGEVSKPPIPARKKMPAKLNGRQRMDSEGVAKALQALRAGVRPSDIARMCGVTPAAITDLKRRFGAILDEVKNVDAYRNSKSELLDASELVCLKSSIKAANDAAKPPNLRDSALAFKVFHEAGRLERGLSTRNVSNKIQFTHILMPDHEAPLEASSMPALPAPDPS